MIRFLVLGSRMIVRIWMCILFGCILSSAASAGAPLARSILVINPSTSLRPWPAALIAGIRAATSGDFGGAIAYYIEHLDLYQFGNARYEDSLRNHFADKYRDMLIGAIVAIGPRGLDLALKLRASLWPTQPLVFAAVDEGAVPRTLPRGVTGTAVQMTLANMMKAGRMVVPNLRRFAMVGDRFEDQLIYGNFAKELPNFTAVDGIHRPLGSTHERSQGARRKASG